MTTEEQIHMKLSQFPESLKQEVLNYIEFLLYKQTYQTFHSNLSRKRIFGSAKGKYQLAANFDAPLEDFKDYM